jgi:hypothetical protein
VLRRRGESVREKFGIVRECIQPPRSARNAENAKERRARRSGASLDSAPGVEKIVGVFGGSK